MLSLGGLYPRNLYRELLELSSVVHEQQPCELALEGQLFGLEHLSIRTAD